MTILMTLGLAAAPATPAMAVDAAGAEAGIARGHALLQSNCARCHAVEESGESPFAPAPPFRTLHERYEVEDLEEALAEGIVSGHPAMPEFIFGPAEVEDIIAYLKTLR